MVITYKHNLDTVCYLMQLFCSEPSQFKDMKINIPESYGYLVRYEVAQYYPACQG